MISLSRLRILALLLLAAIPTQSSLAQAGGPPNSTPEKLLVLWDDKPAPLDLKGWEFHSFPLGNGYFGVSFFGGIGEELWQFTDKSLFVKNPETDEKRYDKIALSSLCELRLFQDQRPGSFSGLRAFGGFSLSAQWKDGHVEKASVFSKNGGPCRLCANGATIASVTDSSGKQIPCTREPGATDILEFETQPNAYYRLSFNQPMPLGH